MENGFAESESTDFFRRVIKSVPSFKKTVQIASWPLASEINSHMESFIFELGNKEKKSLELALMVSEQLESLSKGFKALEESLQDLAAFQKSFAERFELDYSSYVGSAYDNLAVFSKLADKSLTRSKEFLQSSFFDFLRYKNAENENFGQFVSFTRELKERLKNIQSSLDASKPEASAKGKDVELFRAYLNHLTLYNFKQFYVLKNRQMNENLSKFVEEKLNFESEVNLADF